jgi:hypothetical protein
MEVLLKKHFWIISGSLTILLAFFSARLVTAYVSYEILVIPTEVSELDELAEGTGFYDFRGQSFVSRVTKERRNEIIEGTKPVVEQPPVENLEDPNANGEDKEDTEEKQEGGVVDFTYLAAVVSSNAANSLGFVQIDSDPGIWVSVGSELKYGVKVTAITRSYIKASDGSVKYLWEKREAAAEPEKPSLLRKKERPKSKVATRDKKKAAPKNNKFEGISQKSAWEYQIDRAFLDEQLQDMGKLTRDARVIPNYDRESGTYKGFKLIGVRPNSMYRSLGIKSGDVILNVNGDPIDSPTKALELFNKLQTSNSINMDIKRRGKTETLIYKIQ